MYRPLLLTALATLFVQTPAPTTPDPRATATAPVVAPTPEEPKIMVALANRILTLVGTPGDDVIDVRMDRIELVVGNERFPVNEVDEIIIAGEDGNDRLTVTNDWARKVTIYGGGGNDLVGGGGGDDTLFGGWGDDQLFGGVGDDLLIGGGGADRFQGGAGRNKEIQEHGKIVRRTVNFPEEIEIVELLNSARAKEQLAPLVIQPQLNQAAIWHVENMALRSLQDGYEIGHAHTLDGVSMPTLSSRMDGVGYPYRSVRENIAYGYPTAEALVAGWMSSPGHRENILAEDVQEVGIAIADDEEGVPFYCVVFASPLPQPSNPNAGFHPLSGN
jgi:hypothetical protein